MSNRRTVLALVATLAIGSCSTEPLPQPSTYLPVHHLESSPEAELTGTLLAREQCLVAVSSEPRDVGERLVIWPAGTRLISRDGEFAVSTTGGIVGIGTAFTAGGGEYEDRAFIEQLIGQPIPNTCVRSVYWVITTLIPPR